MWKYTILLFIIFIIVTEQSEYTKSKCQLKELKIDNYDISEHCYNVFFIGDLLDNNNIIIENNITIYKDNSEYCYNNKYFIENWEFNYNFNDKYICYYSLKNNDAYLEYHNLFFEYIFISFVILLALYIYFYVDIDDKITNIDRRYIKKNNNNNNVKLITNKSSFVKCK